MKSRRSWMAFLWLVLVACLFVSCGSGGDTKVDTARMQELGNDFMTQLDEIIPLRVNDESLLSLNTLTVLDDKTHNLSALDTFYEDYRVGSEAELIMIYRTKSFVVNKIIFDGTAGYYYRYELNPADEKAINIDARPISEVTIGENTIGDIRQVILTLKSQTAQDAVFTFENIVEPEEPAVEP